jgi:hypothetical protein
VVAPRLRAISPAIAVSSVQERWQQRQRFDRAGRGQLRDRQHGVDGLFAIAGLQVDIRQRAVGRAQVDADGVARLGSIVQ